MTNRTRLLKAILYRFISVILTAIIFFLFTGLPILAIQVGIADIILKTLLYFGFDALWDKFSKLDEKSQPATIEE
jgi:uncharacterized membrane protein